MFEGQFGNDHVDAIMAIGNGKILSKEPGQTDDSGRWAPLATGEFLLGHPDEAQENCRQHRSCRGHAQRHLPGVPQAALENVASFTNFIDA